jgi:hypothetical protein
MSGNITTTASDIVLGGLLQINAFSPGQNLSNEVGSSVMQVLNDLLDSLSTDEAFIYTQSENIFQWTSGQYQYSIGNPTASNTFAATATSGSPTLTGIVNPTAITVTYGLNSSGIQVGGTVTDTQGYIPSGTTIVSVNTTLGTLTMSQNAISSGSTSVSYTIPGNFAISRPLRVRNSFTRVTTSAATGLDYFIDVISFDRYNEIGLKSVPGPWPYVMAYQQTYPYGTLWVYPNPQIEGAAYLFTDLILNEFTTLNQSVSLPQGYNRALKKLLALELCPMFGKTPSPELILQAKEAKNLIKAQNDSPVTTLRYDSDLIYSRHTDASWIVTGGFV